MSGYIPRGEFEVRERATAEAQRSQEEVALKERQAETIRKNMYNFAQLRDAGFPGTVPVEFYKSTSSRFMGVSALLGGKDVGKTRGGSPWFTIQTGVEQGYLLAGAARNNIPGKSGGGSFPTDVVLTTNGVAYLNTQNHTDSRGCVEIYGGEDSDSRVMLSEFKEPLRFISIHSDPKDLAPILEGVTKNALKQVGIDYIPYGQTAPVATSSRFPMVLIGGERKSLPQSPLQKGIAAVKGYFS